MNRLYTGAALGGATLIFLIGTSAVTARPAFAQGNQKPPQDVRVVNAPLPVEVQGTANVAVGSLPPVQIDGTPTVNVGNQVSISSLPAVQLDGTPSVSISNNASNPVPVTMSSSREPIDRLHSLTFPSGQIGGGDTVYTVPAGKMLIIERFFVKAIISTGEFSEATLERTNGDVGSFPILMEHQGADFSGRQRYVGSIEGPFFFPAGTRVQGNFLRTGTGETIMTWSFTGYLE